MSNGDTPPLDWDRPLFRRRGATHRLGGLDVYYDFDWSEVFNHDRAIFPGGQSLAGLVTRDCPDGKCAALLLTERTDIKPSICETPDSYVVIVPIHTYLDDAGADTACSFFARLSGAPLTKLQTLADVAAFSGAELQQFLDEHLSPEALMEWASGRPDRLETLAAIGREGHAVAPAAEDDAGRDAVSSLEDVIAFVDALGNAADLKALVLRVTQSEGGRKTTSHVLGIRLAKRITDTRDKLAEYQTLIARPDATETDVQRFLESDPWILGLPYVGARPHVEIPRGEIDFVLDRFDGFFDIVELKGPKEPIIVEPHGEEGTRPPSACTFAVGPALAKALAQAHHYRSILDSGRELHGQYGLADS